MSQHKAFKSLTLDYKSIIICTNNLFLSKISCKAKAEFKIMPCLAGAHVLAPNVYKLDFYS